MKFTECCKLISSDLNRLELSGCVIKRGGVKLMTSASFKVTFWFRLGTYLQSKGLLFKPLYLLVAVIHKHIQYKTGIQLSIGTKVGKGLMFPHFSCIIINGGAVIGDYCTIFQGVTIGSVRGEKGGVPKIGSNVVISSGSSLIGNITIGNNVMIGSGAVVVKSIPDNAVVVGNPARIVSSDGVTHTRLYIH